MRTRTAHVTKPSRRRFPVRTPRRTADLLTLLGLANEVANIIMQLSMPGVGYGVVESRVDGGNAFIRPFKRARTTGTYLAVALIGEESDRSILRDELGRVHAYVRSTADSPVPYHANNPDLQLWVAACLYRYFVDQFELLYGSLDPTAADAVYADAARLATTLNVRPEQWPADRAEFERYWARTLPTLRIDPPVRTHLDRLATLDFLVGPWGPVGRLIKLSLGGPFRFFTIGTLPPEFRELMGYDWSPTDQRVLDRLLRLVALADRTVPFAGRLGYRMYLLDMRARVRAGRSVLGASHRPPRPVAVAARPARPITGRV
ncbi:oxygenase MpaB family protein [Skermania piniformis]|uniref:DUF2236 domain-containing protein n=1 Tax=Skermania pinensis TaxID=39122 RepID=A0ABX8S8Z4_9ACTN|nr:oxygenase MpaB family protein [Skermania piniformis]QXQ14309.1 DUF2236 domain-containing protein [Skermania piniformis]